MSEAPRYDALEIFAPAGGHGREFLVNPSPAAPRLAPERFYSLDVLRGVAALAVVFWHWQHFFFVGYDLPPQFDRAQQPLYPVFALCYEQGYRAVDLFFCLSGFIFFWLYGERIAGREVSARQFAAWRFSRLYPLHFLTLVLVAVGQALIYRFHGDFFAYPHNDLPHFAQQLILASGWGFASAGSFNSPVWSVSVEVVCYAVFFVAAFSGWRRWWQATLLAVAGYGLLRCGVFAIGRGLLSFFIGGLVFELFCQLRRRQPSRYTVCGLVALTAVLWWAVPFQVQQNGIYQLYRKVLGPHDIALFGKHPEAILFVVTPYLYELVLFPATLLTLALWEAQRGTLGKRVAILGDISYSTYLWHFPLQLLFYGILISLSLSSKLLLSPLALLLFFALLIPLALWSHYGFERPCQARIRKWTGSPARALRVNCSAPSVPE